VANLTRFLTGQETNDGTALTLKTQRELAQDCRFEAICMKIQICGVIEVANICYWWYGNCGRLHISSVMISVGSLNLITLTVA
jgi:hypothetical protein